MSTTTPAVIERETALARLQALDPQALIEKAIETGAGVETMERILALAERVQKISAKQAYDAAMAEFQRHCPPILKTKEARITTRSGPGYRYSFAPLDEITTVISPLMGSVGLSFRWRVPTPEEWKPEPQRVAQICRITHALGHYEESGVITMPVDHANEGVGANSMQRVGIALTYAKKYSLLVVSGRSPEDYDQDGKTGGDEGNGVEPVGRVEDGGGADGGVRMITDNQQKRFHAIARGLKPVAWTDEQIHTLLTARRINSIGEIPMAQYDAIIDALKAGPAR